MKTRVSLSLFIVFAFVASCVGGLPVRAQQGQPTPFSFTAAGQFSAVIPANSSCSVVVYNTGGGVTIVPQSTSDLAPSASSLWNTATGINSGSITTSGTFTGSVTIQTNGGLTGFRLFASALTSGTASGVFYCSSAQASQSVTVTGNVSVSPIPLPVQVSGIPTVQVSGTVAVSTAPPFVPANPLPVTTAPPQVFVTASPGNLPAFTIAQANGTPWPNPLPVTTPAAPATDANSNQKSATTDANGVQPFFCTSRVQVALSGSSLTSVIAVSGSTKIYVCSALVDITSGTNPTTSLSFGTGAACVTTNTVWLGPLGGALVTSGAEIFPLVWSYPIVSSAGQALCAQNGGTGTDVSLIFVTYLQQ